MMMSLLLGSDKTGMVILDVQEKLVPVMGQKERVIENILRLIHLSNLFNFPVILTEQYPKWLGTTLTEIKENLRQYDPIQKMYLTCKYYQ